MPPSVDTVETTVTQKEVHTKGSQDVKETLDSPRPKANENKELEIAAQLGAPDVYVDNVKDTEWVLLAGTIYIKLLRIENRSGIYVVALKSDEDAELGKHRHRGMVKAVTVQGSWGYHEYDWEAKAGDYICETPGTIHALYMKAGAHIVLDVMGSIEFFNEDNTLREIFDGFSVWRMYVEHCEQKGLKPNEGLWY